MGPGCGWILDEALIYILHVDDVKFYRKSSSRNALKIRGRTVNIAVGAAESQHSQMIVYRSGFGTSGKQKWLLFLFKGKSEFITITLVDCLCRITNILSGKLNWLNNKNRHESI